MKSVVPKNGIAVAAGHEDARGVTHRVSAVKLRMAATSKIPHCNPCRRASAQRVLVLRASLRQARPRRPVKFHANVTFGAAVQRRGRIKMRHRRGRALLAGGTRWRRCTAETRELPSHAERVGMQPADSQQTRCETETNGPWAAGE